MGAASKLILKQRIISRLIYDKDKNNEPATRYNGERAHWLMITGFCYKPSKTNKVLTSSILGNVTSQPANS